MVEQYPVEAAQLLRAFLSSSPQWFYVNEDCTQLWRKLVEAHVPPTVLEDIRGHLVRLGGNLEDFLV